MDIESRIQRLEDIESIKQLVATYAKAVDLNGNREMLDNIFTKDSSWNCEGIGGWKGHDNVVQGLHETCTSVIPWAFHYMMNFMVDVNDDGKTAYGEYYLWEVAKVANDSARNVDTLIAGWYETDFVKEDDGLWRFKHIELKLKINGPVHTDYWETPIAPWSG
tara:strand:- start:14 stop:502 length:489 start_codon:yes stop_codon:yes gene_type:complete